MHNSTHPFVLAVDLVGAVKMARALKISPQAISKMRKLAEANSQYLVPSNHLRAIESITGGRVTVTDLLVESKEPAPT